VIDLLVRHARTITLDPQRRILVDGAIAIGGGRFVEVGPDREVGERHEGRARETIDARGAVAHPGLIDAHDHTNSRFLRGFYPRGAADWSDVEIATLEGMTPAIEHASAVLACMEMIASGTTTYADTGGSVYLDETARAIEGVGVRGIAGWFVVDAPDALPAVRVSTAEGLARLRDQVGRYPHRGPAAGRARSAVLLSGMGTDTEELLVAARAVADELDVPLIMHQSWSPGEVETSLRLHGRRPVERLADLGVLGPRVTLAHAIHLDDAEVALLAEHGTAVVHCPPASVLRGVGAFRVGRFPELLAAGVPVALGSDGGRGSKHDLLRAAYLAVTVHREVRGDAGVLTAEQVLEMATLHGARAVGLAEEIGSIEPGKRADLVIHDLDRTESHPTLLDPVEALVSVMQSGTVATVLVDGEVVYRDRRFTRLDAEAAFAEADRIAAQFEARIGADRFSRWPLVR
jgi:cytosine/adenosine deaminase-related metal-dependent hydrolase